MPSKKTVLQSRETEQTRSLTIKIPLALAEDIQRFREELARQAPNLVFNASAVCTEALRQALRQARKELAEVKVGLPVSESVSDPQMPLLNKKESQ